MKIRHAKIDDLSQMVNIAREVRQHHIEILKGYFKPQDDTMERNIISSWVVNPNYICLVAEDNSKILGIILAEIKDQIWLEQSKTIMIHNFGVAKEAQRKGIGKKLMEAIYNECQIWGVQEIKLGVFNKNISAYKFYENFGFEAQEQKMSLKVK